MTGVSSKQGFTLLEILVVVGIMGIVFTIAALNLRPLSNDLQAGANEVAGTFKQARAKAMATTSAYRITPTNNLTLAVERAKRCGDAESRWTAAPQLGLTLRENVRLTTTNWELCFSSRGLVDLDSNFSVSVADAKGKTLTVETLLGGAVSVQ